MNFAVTTSSRLKVYHPRDFELLPKKDRYTIGEIEYICGITPKDFKYWSEFFYQLKFGQPRTIKRFLSPQEVLVLLHIRELIYNQGLTPTVARFHLDDLDLTKTDTLQMNSNMTMKSFYENHQIAEQYHQSIIDDNPIIISASSILHESLSETNHIEAESMPIIISSNAPAQQVVNADRIDPIQELNELNNLINNVIPLFSPNNQWKIDPHANIELDMNLGNTNLDDIPDRIELDESTQDHFTAEQIQQIKKIHDLEFQAQQSTLQGHSGDIIHDEVKTQYAQLYLTRLTLFKKELHGILDLLTVNF